MVQGRPNQAHRPRHVREDLIRNNNRTRSPEPGPDSPVRTGWFSTARIHASLLSGSSGTTRLSTAGRLRVRHRFHTFSTAAAGHGRTDQIATTSNRKSMALKEAMTKTQLVNALSESTGLQKKDVASVLEQLGAVIERHIKRRAVETFTLPGLLKIKVVRKPATKARKMISPFNGQEITVAAKPTSRAVKVQPLSRLKRMTE